MKRRHFLAGAATAALPVFLQRAFATPALNRADRSAKPDTVGKDRVFDVSAAWHAAVVVGKPLLVILVPSDNTEKYRRGQLWGAVLNHAPDSVWEALACVEVVCADAAAVKAVLALDVDDGDLFVFAETDAVPAVVRAYTANIPPPVGDHVPNEDWQETRRRGEAVARQRIAIVGALLEGAVFGAPELGSPVRPLLAARAARRGQNNTNNTNDSNDANDANNTNDTISDDRNAARLIVAGQSARAIAAAQARLKTQRVRGSKWANAGGCGTRVEGETDRVGIACGMGHVPELSGRFLYWFTKKDE